MVIDMNEKKLVTLDQLRGFIAATSEVEFQGCGQDDERYPIDIMLPSLGGNSPYTTLQPNAAT